LNTKYEVPKIEAKHGGITFLKKKGIEMTGDVECTQALIPSDVFEMKMAQLIKNLLEIDEILFSYKTSQLVKEKEEAA